MLGKSARINFERCKPETHDPENGKCDAVLACKKRLLEQEEYFESPMLFSAVMCVGCGDCVRACPSGAIQIVTL